MELDHKAIYEAYKNEENPVITVSDESGAFAQDGTKIKLDNAKIANARAFLDAEYAKVKYKDDRQPLYPPLEDFADAMYWNSKGDATKLEAYYAACEKVKTDNPKPS